MPESKDVGVAAKPGKLTQVGELWALGGVLGFAVANVIEGDAMRQADPWIGPLIRGLPSLVMGLVLLFIRKTYRQLQPRSGQYIGHWAVAAFVIPGVLSTVGLFAYFFALQVGGVTITVPVQQSYIIWGAVASWLYLGERFTRIGLLGVGVLVAGLVVLVLGQLQGTPVSGNWFLALPLALFTAISWGVSGVFLRDGQLRGADQSTGIVLHFIASEIVALIGLMVFSRWGSVLETSAHVLGALVAGGVLSGIIGIYCLFTSLKLLSVTRAYALNSLTPLMAALLAYLFLKERLNWPMLLGIVMVCVGVALVQIFKPAEAGSGASQS
jgi:drug/metabolite transporter (DMT)-like permease